MAAGTYSTFARTADGQVYAWGLNNYGQLGLPGQAPEFAPTLVGALKGKGVKEIVAGQHHTLAITEVWPSPDTWTRRSCWRRCLRLRFTWPASQDKMSENPV